MPEPQADPDPAPLDEKSEGGPVVAADPHASDPFWRKPEYAWPLALVAGFGGTWLGIRTSTPGALALLAALPFGFLYLGHVRADLRVSAALLASVWILGIVGATVGDALEGAARPELFPGAVTLVETELGFLRGDPSSPLATLPRNLTAFLLIGVLARPLWGLPAVLASALLAGAVGAASASWAVEAVAGGWTPSLAALAGSPPHLLLGLMAAQVLAAALAVPGAGLAIRSLTDVQRSLLWSAAALGGVALGLQGQWVVAWRAWLSG